MQGSQVTCSWHCGEVVKRTGSGVGLPGSECLCDLGQTVESFCASVSSSAEQEQQLLHRF